MPLDQIILRLIEAEPVTDQANLLAHLASRGHEVTQSTLSRHLKRLSVRKVDGRYRRVEPTSPEFPGATMAEVQPNLLVLRTAPGFAQALAVALDRDPAPGQAGTLAGDDTVFVAVEAEKLSEAKAHLRRWLGMR
jgi:transcriptional regulator of arginine metabolism